MRIESPLISVVIVSFNTCSVLRECLQVLESERKDIASEVFVVDNNSRDLSVAMVESEFPQIRVIRSTVNLGFAGANNQAFPECKGKYIVLLNSDAFLLPGALRRAIEHMESDASVGLAGARLTGRDGSWQPSARMFPSALNEFFSLTGLSARFGNSRLFGRQDRTWADQSVAAEVDWVPGAFVIVRRDVLEQVGYFDEDFFLYYEEVDLCRRIKLFGYAIWYWPDIVVAHLGGESSKSMQSLSMSKSGAQLTLWRMRSELLYYRKHLGKSAWLVKMLEEVWHRARLWKNETGGDSESTQKANDSRTIISLMQQAWNETQGGRFSPQRPW
jgi:GT2 family glycosyltransferase